MIKLSKFEDLIPFVKAMEAEYLRHYPQKGESWKQDGQFLDPRSSKAYPQYFNQDQYLRNIMFNCLQKYSRKHDPSELVDIANICAMLWMRTSDKTQTPTPKATTTTNCPSWCFGDHDEYIICDKECLELEECEVEIRGSASLPSSDETQEVKG